MNIGLYMCGGEKPVSQYPLGLGYLKSNCESAGVTVDILGDPADIASYDMVGLSANAWGIKEAYDILQRIRQSGRATVVVLGGQGTLWDKCKDLGFDHVVIGEGESALSGIIAGRDDKVISDRMPKDIDFLKYPVRGACKATVPILSARGCPYECRFCSSKTYWQGVRFHSADYFLGEVEYVASEYPKAKELYILDDLFIAKPSRFFEIHKKWMAKGLNKRFRLESFVRSNMFTDEICVAMKEMGFAAVRFGAESASDRMLGLLKKQTTVADHQRTIDIANKHKLPVSASFMFGLPDETEEDVRLTNDFIRSNAGKLEVRGRYRFKAFPGTAYYNGEDLLTSDMRVR